MKKNRTSRRLPFIVASAFALLACDSARRTPPLAQESSMAEPTALVHVQSGMAFTASCVIVRAGETVEWRNLSPRASVIVLSLREPYELSSPALLSPYNFVPPEQSDECAQRESGKCLDEPKPFSYWRHTFTTPGIFEYQDQAGNATNTSGGYAYGLPPGPSTTSRSVGTVCVKGENNDCQNVCCTGTVQGECGIGVSCISGRCGGVTP